MGGIDQGEPVHSPERLPDVPPMYWLLLPIALIACILGIRTTSAGMMVFWLMLTALAIGLWAWLRYKALFPDSPRQLALTPLDRQQLEHLREQTRANRDAEAAAAQAAEHEAEHPIHPVHVPVAHSQAPVPVPPVERPLTGRAVFVVPDDPPLPAGPQEGDTRR